MTTRIFCLSVGFTFLAACHRGSAAPSPLCTISPARSSIAWQYAAGLGGIRGRVISARTAAPIANAAIDLEPGAYRAATDSAGQFQLRLPRGSYVVRIRALGYRDVRESIALPGLDGFELLGALAQPNPGLIGCTQ